MEQERRYEIFTDASFDDKAKVGTYAIVIIQEKKVIKAIVKKCNVQLENSTECEVFAIFRAINIIEGSLLKKKVAQKFWLRTDCAVAKDFFIEENSNIKIFEKNEELLNTIKKSYNRIKKRLAKKDCSFKLKWIPRGANKVAHKYSYSAFKKLKQTNSKNDIILIDKKSFLEILQKFNSKQCKIIIYLFQISNEDKFILKTQTEIAKSLEISIYYINKTFQEL
ncbi:MAG: reverse transcriptase-like protein, partial [Clostridia bacterium]|nr:reverse transcriptase-like protein [Clostridia bacterium]